MNKPKVDESLLEHAVDLLTARYEANKNFNEYLLIRPQ